jgi:hypothetical protein
VASLVEMCVEDLVAGLTVENVTERLIFADLIGEDKIREASLSFICESPARLARVQNTDGYKRLSEQRPRLLTDIVAKMVPPSGTKKRPAGPADLPDNLYGLSVPALKRLCSDRGLRDYGSKQVMVQRLQQHARER